MTIPATAVRAPGPDEVLIRADEVRAGDVIRSAHVIYDTLDAARHDYHVRNTDIGGGPKCRLDMHRVGVSIGLDGWSVMDSDNPVYRVTPVRPLEDIFQAMTEETT